MIIIISDANNDAVACLKTIYLVIIEKHLTKGRVINFLTRRATNYCDIERILPINVAEYYPLQIPAILRRQTNHNNKNI